MEPTEFSVTDLVSVVVDTRLVVPSVGSDVDGGDVDPCDSWEELDDNVEVLDIVPVIKVPGGESVPAMLAAEAVAATVEEE